MTILSFAILAFTYNWITGSSAAPFNTSLIKPEWDSRFFPNPLLHPSKCGRGLNKSFICDPEKILNPIQAKQLDDLIDAKTRTFRCTCQEKCISNSDRYVIMVAIVPRVKVRTGATIDEKKQAVDDFAKALQRRHWAAGNCDNDIVIVLSTEYRRVATFAGKKTRKIMNNSCILNATKAVSLLLELDRYFAVIQELVWVYSTNLNKTMCANEPPLQGGPAKHPVVLYVILAILAGIGVTILVWVTRLCIKGCIHRKKKAKLEEENVGTDKSIKMETTVVYSPKSGVGIDAEMDTKSEDSKEDRHERQKSKSNEQVSSSPKAGTSSEGASGYTPRKGRNPGSFRDKRPSLSLDLSKCKHMDDDTAKAKKAERQGFLETQY